MFVSLYSGKGTDMNYLRGSEWRRWDLHIHTPGTKKNDNFEGSTIEDKWEQFYTSIEEYIGDGRDPLKDIAVIGITDYLSIDNYLKVMKDKRIPESIKLVLPNIELRMSPISKKGLRIFIAFLILKLWMIWRVVFFLNPHAPHLAPP